MARPVVSISVRTLAIVIMLTGGCAPPEARSTKTLADLAEFLNDSGLSPGKLEKDSGPAPDQAPGLLEAATYNDVLRTDTETMGRFLFICYRFDTSANASKYVELFKRTSPETDHEPRRNGAFVIVDVMHTEYGGRASKALRAFQP